MYAWLWQVCRLQEHLNLVLCVLKITLSASQSSRLEADLRHSVEVCVYTGSAPIPPTQLSQLGCLDLTDELRHMSSAHVCV